MMKLGRVVMREQRHCARPRLGVIPGVCVRGCQVICNLVVIGLDRSRAFKIWNCFARLTVRDEQLPQLMIRLTIVRLALQFFPKQLLGLGGRRWLRSSVSEGGGLFRQRFPRTNDRVGTVAA